MKAMLRQIQFNEGVPMKWLAPMFLCVLTACGADPEGAARRPREVADDVLLIGKIQQPRITESSGVVVSRKNPEIFWTHNDGGGRRQVLYAMRRTGQPLAEFRITGAVLEDWEDIAADANGNLLLGDIGNNDAKRTSIAVHQLPEPSTNDASGLARVSRTWTLRYPQTPFDSESLFVWGESGYLISKVVNDERADIYRFSLTNAAPFQTLEVVAEVKIDSPVTGADISQDGNLLGMVAKNGAYVFRINGDVTRAAKGKPFQAKFKHDHIEGCAFVPEGLLATAESREIYLFTDEAFRTGPVKKK
jgi:hypothetical protein